MRTHRVREILVTPLAVKIIIPEPMTKRFEVRSSVLARSASNDGGTDCETARRAVLMRPTR